MTYEEFAATRLASLARYAMVLTGDTHTAQDLVQETMVRAQLHWRKVSRADSPEGYVKRMMINLYVDWRRGSWWRRVLVRSDAGAEVRVSADLAEGAADRDLVWQALARLPRQQRAALVLRFYEDLPDAQIAEALGCTVGTARGYISKALATLRTRITPGLVSGGSR
ncbi:MAG: SigE family RNA polymerase sigma factor [Hamadaea sp.]|nr:SigE family RNA polymerase sigma factor [Hamadaea sp.]NUT17689.1 SigE family RNA polymerase sigma factor [Hamadaea sp.]